MKSNKGGLGAGYTSGVKLTEAEEAEFAEAAKFVPRNESNSSWDSIKAESTPEENARWDLPSKEVLAAFQKKYQEVSKMRKAEKKRARNAVKRALAAI